MADDNYTLGRGEIYFAPFLPGTQIPDGERYLGNTPDFSLTFASTKLDHFSSDRGIKEKDKSVVLEINRTGKLVTDNINPQNVALFFFGDYDALAVTAATITNEVVGPSTGEGVKVGMFYQLGSSDMNPGGARKIIYPGVSGTLFTLKKGATTLVHGTDYNLDAERGRIEILEGGAIVDGDDLTSTYSVAASTRTRIMSGSAPVEGQIRFIAQNPTGKDIDYLLPYVTLSPDGDYALKGDTWQQIPFSIEVLKRGSLEALYADGQAVAA